MATFLSPEVRFQETDLTTSTTGVATSVGAFAGEFVWGPVNTITQVTNEVALVSRFGKPTNSTFESFFSAKNFLDYSNNLMLVRVATAGQLHASAIEGIGNYVISEYINDGYVISGSVNSGMFAAKYPGDIGNSLRVSLCDTSNFRKQLTGTIAVTANSTGVTGTGTQFTSELAVGSNISFTVSGNTVTKKVLAITSDTAATLTTVASVTGTGLAVTSEWEYAYLFNSAPVESNKAISMNATNDGMHAVVIDEDGLFTGAPGSVLETFDNISKASNALRFDGTSGYYKTVLNNSSYIYWMKHPVSGDLTSTGADFGSAIVANAAYKSFKKPMSVSLVNGSNGTAATDGEIKLAYDLFKNKEKTEINLLITGKVNASTSQYIIQNIAEDRLDCVVFVSPCKTDGSAIIGDSAESLTSMISWYNDVNTSSSYGFADSGYKYQYDKYNDIYRWIPLNADVAGLCARTDFISDTWYSPAGLNRGQIKNVTRLAFNPDKAQRDELFKRNINPVVTFPGEGTVLFGDKTMLRRPSAFDSIGVRRLFIYLEKVIVNSSKYFLFEQNTELTRQLFAGLIIPVLRDVKGRQGVTDFYVDVGSDVNTPDTIDAGELRCNIFIKPTRSIRFINLNFIATKTSANFSEIEL